MTYLVDSDVLICLLKGVPGAAGWALAARHDGRLAASVVAVAEVRQGMRAGERAATERLLDSLELLPVTREVAVRAGDLGREFRRSHRLGTPDLLVAATALQHRLPLATLNVKHFPMFDGLVAPFVV